MRRWLPLLFLLIALPLHAQELNPGGGIILQTSPLVAVFPPGPVTITGNSANGTDQINNVSLNGDCNPLAQAGAPDIGVQVNNCINWLSTFGGTIRIPAGHYGQTTTIQCSSAASKSIIIEGAAGGGSLGTEGTALDYNGNGDAINNFFSNTANQNWTGCQIRDLALYGVNAGANAVGFHFGGTTGSVASNVEFYGFKKAGIEIENAPSMWTERYTINNNTQFWGNGIAIYGHGDASSDPSLGHGYIDAWFNVNSGEVGIEVDGGLDIYSTPMVINGNVIGTAPVGTLMYATGSSTIGYNPMQIMVECDGSVACNRFKTDAGSQIAGIEVADFTPFAGPWTDVTGGALNLWGSVEFALSQSGQLGGMVGGAATNRYQACFTARQLGHVSNIIITTDLNGGTCTTPPHFSVINVNTAAVGTAAIPVATDNGAQNYPQSLAFTAGQSVCLTRLSDGVACTVPWYMVTADVTQP